jgi:hypothetical protein
MYQLGSNVWGDDSDVNEEEDEETVEAYATQQLISLSTLNADFAQADSRQGAKKYPLPSRLPATDIKRRKVTSSDSILLEAKKREKRRNHDSDDDMFEEDPPSKTTGYKDRDTKKSHTTDRYIVLLIYMISILLLSLLL